MKIIDRQSSIVNQSGMSIVEIIVALAIYSLMSAAMVSLILGSYDVLGRSTQIAKARNLADEAYEATRSVRNRAWNELVYSQTSVVNNGGNWELSGEGTSDQIGNYTRTINFLPVYRNASFDIVAADDPEARLDLNTKNVLINVTWTGAYAQTSRVKRQYYLSNWDVIDRLQTDWSGGFGQEYWSEENKFMNSDGLETTFGGEIFLQEIGSTSLASIGTIESSAFPFVDGNVCTSISWDDETPEGCPECSVKMQLQSASDNSGQPGVWSLWSGPSGRKESGTEDEYYTNKTGELIPKTHNTDKWFRYRATLTGNGTQTPILREVRISCSRR